MSCTTRRDRRDHHPSVQLCACRTRPSCSPASGARISAGSLLIASMFGPSKENCAPVLVQPGERAALVRPDLPGSRLRLSAFWAHGRCLDRPLDSLPTGSESNADAGPDRTGTAHTCTVRRTARRNSSWCTGSVQSASSNDANSTCGASSSRITVFCFCGSPKLYFLHLSNDLD